MPSELDVRIRTITEALTGADGPMPLTTFRQHGVDLPMIAAAPPALTHYFAHFCEQHKDVCFIVDGDQRLTFGETHAMAVRVAKALISAHGVQRGDRIGIAMRNAPSWIVLYMATLMAGGCATLLNGWWQGGELAAGIDDVEAKLVFVDAPRAQRIADAGYAGGARLITLDIGKPIEEAMAPLIAGGDDNAVLPELTGNDLATILFTSGSTGQSKGAYSTHRAVIQGTLNYIVQALMVLQVATEDGLLKADRPPHATLLTVPLFHVTGEIPVLLVSFAIGRKVVMMPKWNVVTAMELIEREKITNFTGVPLMSFELMTSPERHNYDLSSLQGLAGGGAPRPPEHVRKLAEEFPTAPPALGYGLTETNAIGCGNISSNYIEKPNSTGLASKPLVDLAILDDAGKAIAQGNVGEVSIRSVALFSGYWNRPDASAACMTADGYFRTGDLGYLDPDDYLFIVDRKKDIIIRGGENISCQEVEAAIYEHPDVAEVCVFGLPDERLGEVPGAVVYLQPGHIANEEEICGFVKDEIAAFKVPQKIWLSATPLPRLGTEKIDKVALRTQYRTVWAEAA